MKLGNTLGKKIVPEINRTSHIMIKFIYFFLLSRDHFEEFVEENQAIHENTKPEGAYTPLNLNRNLKFKRNFYK